MKKLFLTLLTAIFVLAACVNKPTTENAATGVNEYAAEGAKADGIQRMQPYNYADTVRIEGHTYVYAIHREASDSLPMVVDDEGTRYADNVYRLTIQADGHPYFDRRFTKGAFASYLSSDFRAKGILDGMMCDETLPAITFAVSVSLPQSDMMEPLLLRIDRQGGIAIQRDERGEADLNTSPDDEDGV